LVTEAELEKTQRMFPGLNLTEQTDVVLIDACGTKVSASNVRD